MSNIIWQTSGLKRPLEETRDTASQPSKKILETPTLSDVTASRQMELDQILLDNKRLDYLIVFKRDSNDILQFSSFFETLSCEMTIKNDIPTLDLTVDRDSHHVYTVSATIIDVERVRKNAVNLKLSQESIAQKIILVLRKQDDTERIQCFCAREQAREGNDKKLLLAFSSLFHDPQGLIEDLNNYLNDATENWARHLTYPPFVTILQSHGFGKTRTMKELARRRLSAYVCLRRDDHKGVPSRSPLSDLFLESLNTEAAAKRFLYSFVISFIGTVNEIRQREEDEAEIAKKMINYQPWYYSLANRNDADFQNYQSFEDKVEKMYLSLQDIQIGDSYQKDPSWIEYFENYSMTVFIDEAASLLVDSSLKSTFHESKFNVLRRSVQSLFNGTPIIFVLIDTTLKLCDYDPPRTDISSSWRTTELVALGKPYYLLNYVDQLASEYLANYSSNSPQKFTRNWYNNLNTCETLFRLGRPLWASLIDSTYNDIVNYAGQKLLCAEQWASLKTSSEKLCAAIALLSVRTTLAPHLSLSTTNQLIGKHMATAYTVNSERTKVLFLYISEPILAEASASILRDNFCQVFTCISDFVHSGSSLGSLGAVREFVSQVILLKAFDNLQAVPHLYTRSHTLQSFLVSLVGEANFRRYFHREGECLIHPKLLQGTVCFTHFIKKLNKNLTYCQTLKVFDYRIICQNLIHELTFKDFIARAAAGQFKNNKGFDLFIPIILEDDTITYLLIQIKNSIKNFKEAKHLWQDVDPEWFETKTASGKHRRDYLIVVLNLGKDVFEGVDPIKSDLICQKPKTKSSISLNESIAKARLSMTLNQTIPEARKSIKTLKFHRTTINSRKAAAKTSKSAARRRIKAPLINNSHKEARFEQNYAFTFNGFNPDLYTCFNEREIKVLRTILDCERFEVNSIDIQSSIIKQVPLCPISQLNLFQ